LFLVFFKKKRYSFFIQTHFLKAIAWLFTAKLLNFSIQINGFALPDTSICILKQQCETVPDQIAYVAK